MNDASFLGLVQNASLLLAVAFIFDVATIRWQASRTFFRQAIVGLVLGATGITVMLTPWTFIPGIVFDTRSVLVGISGLFFGLFSALTAMTMTAAFRLYLGGTGAWTGVAVILASGVIGIIWRHFRRRPLTKISWRELYLFGMAIHLAMLAIMFTLPKETALRVLSNISLPVLVIYPLGTALLGTLMVNRLQREQSDEALRESKRQYETLAANIAVGVYLLRTTPTEVFSFEYVSPQMSKMLGLAAENILADPQLAFRPIHPEELETFVRLNSERIKAGKPFLWEGRAVVTGTIKWLRIESQPQPLSNGDILWHGVVADITERKIAEEKLQQSEQKYRSIFDNAIEGIFQTTPEGRFVSVNPAMAHIHGFASPEEMISDITNIGEQMYVDPEDRERYRKILEERRTINNFEAQVYRKDGTRIWTSTSSLAVKNTDGRVIRFEGTATDITPRKLAEESLRQTLEKLRKSLAGTIQAMSLTVETRDPYTAGHQRRVSNLACAIAQEMGLPSDAVDNIRMAGIIHDIGKISVPAEILAKPTKLTDIEMSLIKVHSQAGYDILKDVELPYPIAEMVLQHHERLDGSGYPQGLKGDQILLETKILSVADVTEAIATHRPYRPALGIDAALEEIEKNKGILYDEKVVEVCFKLFREGGFKLE